MSERWKYQVYSGAFWGIFMTVFMALFEMKENPIADQLSSFQFYFRFVTFTVVGIFVLGYVNWKAKEKRANKTS